MYILFRILRDFDKLTSTSSVHRSAALGAKVTGYSLNPPTNPSLYEDADVASQVKSIIDDIRNLENLKKAMKDTQPEIVFHLAAQPLVRESYINPVETYEKFRMCCLRIYLQSAYIRCPILQWTYFLKTKLPVH
ncbi:MAG: NAD-dependent epimerase/dehydratase family protein [Chitinivibrionales bacterium]|nr:NAD-dependent epimerase/dehydratase family protein [Chitinivibrionales bacterium]